jgi:diaminohydroxyphosphoribosylaminopyrimidine deaminase/5-amino-6-(5-phosphoribosylamino)uracil reductase
VYADGVTDFISPMQHALALAAKGQGFVGPNPMVGAVVLDAAGRVVGEGWHERFGGPHAEINALNKAGEHARGGTLIVTLEPCCHFGKTPPCTEAVIKAGIRKVIVGMADPFPKVAGGGIAALNAAGIEVMTGVCQPDAERLNAPYLKLLRTGRPWVIQKWAMTLDGKMATHTGDSKWISSEASRKHVHELRGWMDAIIVGGNTVRIDDPLLTARPPGPRMPTRIVISASGHLPKDCQLIRTAKESPVIVATTAEGTARLTAWSNAGVELLMIDSLPALFDELGKRRMTNVMVEGGAKLHAAITDARLADEVIAFVAPIVVGNAETIADGVRLPGEDVVLRSIVNQSAIAAK